MMNSHICSLKDKFMEKIVIGIDISSKTLDICVKHSTELKYCVVENEVKAIKAFFKTFKDQKITVAMENTGRYNWNLFEVLPAFGFEVYVISPLHLKKSLGLIRGKNDKIDALRICSYIEKHQAESLLWKPSSVTIRKLKVLLTERTSRIKIKRQLLSQQKDYKLMKTIGLDKDLLKLNLQMLKAIDKQLGKIESCIADLIRQDAELDGKAALMRSIPGVGQVTCWMMLAKTENFSTITDPRKMACYCGVVPFDFQSGTSVRRKPGLSCFADKEMKSVLHLAAMSAIRLPNKLRAYYLRKVEEGKNRMSILNAVRNKIIHIIFAVIKNQTTYVNDLVLS